MKHLMIDLETLDVKPTAVFVSIGAVIFDEHEIIKSTCIHVNINDSLKYGRTVSGPTLLWWLNQDHAARKMLDHKAAHLLKDALWKLTSFAMPIDAVWGNGATFDVSILEDAYAKMEVPIPWSYQAVRCYRTLKAMFPNIVPPPFKGIKHHAEDDAIHQAKHLITILEHIRGAREELS